MPGFIPEQKRGSNAKFIDRIKVVKGDITRQEGVDAIVSTMQINHDVSGSLNKNIIAAAGEDFDNFTLENIYKPRVNEVYAVPGFNLPVKHVLFVIISNWRDHFDRDDVCLLRCYRLTMKTATEMQLKRIAYPALGTGKYSYAPDKAARLGLQGILERMTPFIEEVRIVCDDDRVYEAFTKRLALIKSGRV